MKRQSSSVLYYLFISVALLFAIVLVDRDPAVWEIASIQVSLFVLLVGICVEVARNGSPETIVMLLVFGVLTGILTHCVYYTRLGLVIASDEQVIYPSWRDALYFSVVTFTTLGYGDLIPREEYRLVAAFQAIFGYLSLGALVGMLVTVFNRRR